MFATQYYCLVASLKEYALDADTKGFDARAIVSGILEEVNRGDAREVRLLYGYYDCENIAALRAGRSAHNPLGNFTREELAEELKAPKRLPEAVARVVRAYADPEGEDAETVDTSRRFEKELFGATPPAERPGAASCASGPLSTGTCATFRRPSRRAPQGVRSRRSSWAAAMLPNSCSAVLRPISGFGANFPISTR